MWKAYDSQSCLRETSGLRGVAPSVRFSESIPGTGEEQIVMHVPSMEDVYLWGCEMFSEGIDCLKIYFIPDIGPLELVHTGGSSISFFNKKKEVFYSSQSASVVEKLPFEDFWNEPYLINKTDEKVVKGNFFRCFSFNTDGYYKIELDETFNPKYLGFNFSPVDFEDTIYGVDSYQLQKSTPLASAENETYQRSNSKLKRVIYVRAISRNNDIVGDYLIQNKQVLNFSSGLIPYRNLPPMTNSSNTSGLTYPYVRIDSVGPWHISGSNSFYRIDTYDNSLNSASHNFLGRLSVIAPLYELSNTVGADPIEDTFRPSSKYIRQGCRAVDMRNGILENVTFYGSEFKLCFDFIVSPDHYWNDSQVITAGSGNPYGFPTLDVTDYQYIHQFISYLNDLDLYNNHIVLDFRGIVFRNCVFDKIDIRIGRKDIMLDGAVFENCKFIGCGLNYLNSSGILIKNCQFEEISTVNGVSLSWTAGESCCVMGCSQKFTERGTLISNDGGSFNDNIWIRHSLYGIDRFQQANEHWVSEGNLSDSDDTIPITFDNNMYIMSRSSMGPALIGFYSVKSKFNIIAFNTFDASLGGGSFFFDNERDADISYNCILYNDTVGFQLRFILRSDHNRIIGCTFRSPQSFNNPASGFNWIAQDEQYGIDLYGQGGFLDVRGYVNGSCPRSNLISDCSIIDYQENADFWGATYNSDNLPLYINTKDPKTDSTELSMGKNIIYKMRKIIENASERSYPIP